MNISKDKVFLGSFSHIVNNPQVPFCSIFGFKSIGECGTVTSQILLTRWTLLITHQAWRWSKSKRWSKEIVSPRTKLHDNTTKWNLSCFTKVYAVTAKTMGHFYSKLFSEKPTRKLLLAGNSSFITTGIRINYKLCLLIF